MSNLRIDELLKQCTVKLSVSENGHVGTGFLIAPGYILTCEHVVRGATAATVGYKNNEDYATATVEQVFADSDVALLQFEPPQELPCVLLDTRVPEVGCKISTFGYPYRYEDDGTPWKGIPALLTMEGTTGDEPPYLQLSLGNVLPGMSGGALLDRKTSQVCGMLKFTRDEHSVMGGGGVMSSTIAQCIPEILETQRRFHERNPLWQEAKPFQPIVENLPQNKTQAFKGREKALGDLHAQIENGGAVAIMSIRGMGGVGKTELALQYADRYRDSYPGGICWLTARESNVGTGLVQYAKARLGLTPRDDVDLPQQVAYCWQQWPGDGDVLVVYDDATDYRLIENYLPLRHGRRFRVLLTTRVQNVATTVTDFPLETLMPAAALELLKAIVGKERIDVERKIAQALCERVGHLPLALELLGYFLKNRPDISLSRLEQQLEKKKLEAKALTQAYPGMTAKLGVYEAFELSWAELSDAGQKLACWLSLFALAPIPWDIAVAAVDENKQDEQENTRDDELLKLSLLQQLEFGSYQLHQLVKEFLLAKLAKQGEKESLKEEYGKLIVSVARQMPQNPTQKIISQLSPLVPHIEEVATRWQHSLGDELLWPFTFLARFYEGQGAYGDAESWLKKCLESTRNRFGDEHPDVTTSLSNLGLLYRFQGRYKEAESLLLQALNVSEKLFGDEHPDVATSLNNLASLYFSQGRYKEAEPLLLQALAMGKKAFGEEHLYVARSLNNLAELYRFQGRYEEAEQLYQQALKLLNTLLGEENLDVASNIGNLALLYRFQGRYEEAEPLCQKVLKLRKKLLGNEHPDVATSLNNLASLYSFQGRYEEAEPLLLQALELQKKLLGNDHPDVATSLNNLAKLYRSQGRHSKSELYYQQVLELLSDEHPYVATSLNNLASLYRFQGRYEEAEPLCQRALKLRKKLLGNDHPDVANSLNSLASLYFSQGRYEEAESLFLQVLKLRKGLLGDDHPDLATTLNNLASLYFSQGRYEEAEPLYQKTLELRKKLLSRNHHSNHLDVVTNLNNLAGVFYYQKRYSDAESHLLEAFDLQNHLYRLSGKQYSDAQGIRKAYIQVITAAIQSNQADTLSDHPMTQDLIPKIRAALKSQEHPS